ncbi:hypothetical protein [Pseudonocardia adelaidensis]|uniref:DUF2076 domain-containing protein n=1 Tax=Pseudonocardia adelaidensis TaxID=648754 RepID=A0ABP9NUX8_9PSEU
MGLLDKLKAKLAGPAGQGQGSEAQGYGAQGYGAPQPPQDPDQAAIERYRYMLRTAPPETVEQAHAEAFAKLTPEQRQKVLTDVGASVPESERATSTDPQAMARMATRAEMRQPGTMERALGGGGGGAGGRGMGMGGMIAGTLLASVAGAFIGSAIADAFFADDTGFSEEAQAAEEPVDEGGQEDVGGFDDGGDFGEF